MVVSEGLTLVKAPEDITKHIVEESFSLLLKSRLGMD